MGIVLPGGLARVTTVNFLGTLHGYGTNCRGKDFGCVSAERAVFIGTEDTDDFVFVSPKVGLQSESDLSIFDNRHGGYGATHDMEFTVAFTPLANTRHRTLSSARFYTDTQQKHQALVIGTGRESPNALAYLGFPGFVERELSARNERGVESVAVSALALGPSTRLFCFANRADQNHCELVQLDPSLARDNKVIGDAETLEVTQGAAAAAAATRARGRGRGGARGRGRDGRPAPERHGGRPAP